MWISQIKFRNFRPFYKEQVLDFDKDSQDKFTVFEAKADTGKTSILSAISWGLYGKEPGIHKDSLNPFNVIRKDEMSDGETDSVYVEISLNEKDEDMPTYIIKRSMSAVKRGDEINFPGGPVLEVQEWEGHDSRPLSEEEAINVINSLLPEDIQGFFLFEGEKLDKIFSFYTPDNIQSAIEKVSQIKQINNGIDHLYVVRDSVYSGSKGKGDDTISENQERITQLQNENKFTKENLQKMEEEVSTAMARKDEINKTLDQVNIPMIKQLNERRKSIQETNEKFEMQLIQKRKDAIGELLRDAPLAMSLKEIKKLIKKIDAVEEKNELPPKIKNIYLNELLTKKMCVCSRSLNPEDKSAKDALESIKKMLEQNDLSEMAETMIQGRYILRGMLEGIPRRITQDRDKLVSECDSIENELKKNKAEIENIDEKLKGAEEAKILELQEERKNIEASIIKQTGSISRLKAAINMKEAKITELRQENDRLGKKKKDYETKRKIAEFLDRTLQVLERIQKEILDEVRHRVEKTTFESFKFLHWDKESYANFSINSSYEMSLKDPKGNERIYNISSGTKHVLLLSFMSALIDVSGYRFPVFIDTPLANTDMEQRENIANVLPKYLEGNQVILLMKDQEYNPAIRKIMKNRVGKEMRLIKIKGKTEVTKWK